MPEQISKYPDVTLRVLKGAGAQCGEGIKQQILTKCPPEKFCALSTGEICVYGIEDIPQMTQISKADLASVVCPSQAAAPVSKTNSSSIEIVGIALVFAVGLLLGLLSRRKLFR